MCRFLGYLYSASLLHMCATMLQSYCNQNNSINCDSMLFWLQKLCSSVWHLGGLCLLLCSFSSGFLWQFWGSYCFIQSLGLFVIVHWKLLWEIWQEESESCSVVSDCLGLHGLYSPWDSAGQITGVGRDLIKYVDCFG